MKSFTTHSMIIGLLVLTLIFTVPVGGVLGENDGGPPGNTEVEEKTKPQWKFDSSQCSVAIDVHKNRNLHRQSLVPGEYLTWSNSFNDSQLTVTGEQLLSRIRSLGIRLQHAPESGYSERARGLRAGRGKGVHLCGPGFGFDHPYERLELL